MSKKSNSGKLKVVLLNILVLTMGIAGYFVFYNYTYNSLEIKTSKDKTIEYGTEKYDLSKFIKESNGEVESITKSINTSVVGTQKVKVVLKKFNISKTVSFDVDVVDTVEPVITLKEENITITQGDDYDIFDNVESVEDDVDGSLPYQSSDSVDESTNYYYTTTTDFDKNTAGEYSVNLKAVDKSGNYATSSFSIKVEKPVVVEKKVTTYAAPAVTYNAAANSNGNGIVATAYSLLGSPYVSGGTSPAGFDCSGFTQYVYAQNGVYVSRSTKTQIYDGVEISYADAQPGDILLWGYSNGYVTHSSIYVGNDQMIHAANPSTGVILSSVSGWTRGSNVQVLHVRRIAS